MIPTEFSGNLYIDLSDTVSYYLKNKNSKIDVTQIQINETIETFPNILKVSGRQIQSSDEITGIVGKAFFNWYDSTHQEIPEEVKKQFFTDRVIAFI